MGIMTTVAISCDKCYLWKDFGELRVPKTRGLARSEGWKRKDGEDICPDCLNSIKGGKPGSYWWENRGH